MWPDEAIFKELGDNFFTKGAQIFGDFGAIFKKHILGNFCEQIGLLFPTSIHANTDPQSTDRNLTILRLGTDFSL